MHPPTRTPTPPGRQHTAHPIPYTSSTAQDQPDLASCPGNMEEKQGTHDDEGNNPTTPPPKPTTPPSTTASQDPSASIDEVERQVREFQAQLKQLRQKYQEDECPQTMKAMKETCEKAMELVWKVQASRPEQIAALRKVRPRYEESKARVEEIIARLERSSERLCEMANTYEAPKNELNETRARQRAALGIPEDIE